MTPQDRAAYHTDCRRRANECLLEMIQQVETAPDEMMPWVLERFTILSREITEESVSELLGQGKITEADADAAINRMNEE